MKFAAFLILIFSITAQADARAHARESTKLRRAASLDDLNGKTLAQAGTIIFGAEGWDQSAELAYNAYDRRSNCRVTVAPVKSTKDWMHLQSGVKITNWTFTAYHVGSEITPVEGVRIDPAKAEEMCATVSPIFNSDCTRTLLARGTYHSPNSATLKDGEGRTVTVFATGGTELSVLNCIEHLAFNIDVLDDSVSVAGAAKRKQVAGDNGVSR